ncbi:LysR family transcriptional regulator [Sphingomonas sp. BK235]|uniref:LysR family transcriptional regulator n=1 Tax=Sphingomonas sp. BK235 TaxID=2512131 RepID=UPI00104F46FB|nr:LysR family transcriptional regulator [Sphingomonas sp. BK235]TCP36082.1 DNA-binding transcriptional LysR family regulator [Sphingomonas sp. BK235]
MDNRLGEMMIFLAVAEHGSFVAAARALRITPSAVSRAIARLEQRLGAQLASRTTRALALTAEGRSYRERVEGLVAEIDAVERSFGVERTPRGTLRVNASVPFGTHCLLPILPTYLRENPAVTVDLTLTDALVGLVEERADVAIRIGPLRDADARARRLGRSTMAVVASPTYLRERGTPTHPRDLEDHVCLRFNFRRAVDSWPFLIDGRTVQRIPSGPFLGSSGEAVRLMAVAGGGIARLGRFHVAADLAAGRLEEVLVSYNPGDGEDIHALFVSHERLALRVRSFVDFMVRDLRLRGGSAVGA